MIILWNLSTSAALVLPAILFLLFVMKKWKKFESSSMKLPPGPKTLPIIGNLHQISSPPFRCFRDLAKRYGPIMYLKLGEDKAVVVSSPEIAKQVLKDHDPNFADRPRSTAMEIMWYNYIDIAFCPYGDYWRQVRKICINELLSPKMVLSFRPIRRDEATRLVDSVREASGRSVNLTEKIFSYSSSITCRAAFGGLFKDNAAALIELLRASFEMAGGFEIDDLFPSWRIACALSWTKSRLMKMRRKLDVILDDIINRHKENMAAENWRSDSERRCGNGEFGGEDLVDVFLRIKEEQLLEFPIANDNIKAVLYDIFLAGTETSSTIIDFAMVELMRNPDVMAKAQAEVRQTTSMEEEDIQKLKYLKLVIKETMRLHPPAPMLPRASREAREINGYYIPAGMKVLVNIWAIQRDPRLWKDPERFEPERLEHHDVDFLGTDFEFLPFGSGRRICPGMTSGLVTMEMALAKLLYNFDWKLPEGVRAEDLNMVEYNGLTAPRKDDLFVVATPYQPLV